MFAAVLDANVLWPSVQRDFLLSLAIEHLYRPLWSAAILLEIEIMERKKWVRRGVTETEADRRALRLIDQMRSEFIDAEVSGWESLVGTYGLPDEDDEHVVAAAFVGNAGAIVTHNIRDFPAESLPDGIDVVEPVAFALNTVALDPFRAVQAVRMMAMRTGYHGPKQSENELLNILATRYGMTETVALMRSVRDDFAS